MDDTDGAVAFVHTPVKYRKTNAVDLSNSHKKTIKVTEVDSLT